MRNAPKHGHARAGQETPEYSAWLNMRGRCFNSNTDRYPRYGGRGITVCARWRDSFENFLADMGRRPPGKTLDRKDNDGNYEPDNCRWATRTEQESNKSTTLPAMVDGAPLHLAEAARRRGINPNTAYWRVRRGMSPEAALSTEVVPHRNGSSGFRGVSWNARSGKWVARVSIGNGKRKEIGKFDDPREAHEARMKEIR